jgi:CubicO group peptidase (beta-lactamase class C family)
MSLIPAFVASLSVLLTAATAIAQSTEQFRVFRDSINARAARDSAPATSIAVAYRGQMVFRHTVGFADFPRRIPATDDTPFPLASVSKPLTGTAVVLLAERGLLQLDAPANNYLRSAEITSRVGSASDITVRTLASHSSGIPRHDYYFYTTDTAVVSRDTLIRRYATAVRPGGTYEYSNLNYSILAAIVERVSKESFAEHMKERVFLPLGMRNTTIGVPPGRVTALSHTTSRSLAQFADGGSLGAGGAYATASDVVTFGLHHLRSAPGSLLREVQRPHVQSAPGNWYGLGLRTDSTTFSLPMIMHTGSNGASASVLIIIPGLELVVAALSNGLSDLPGWAAGEVVRMYGGARGAPAPADSTGPFAMRAFRSTPELMGVWRGNVSTYDGDVPLRFSFGDSAIVVVQMREAAPVRASGLRWEGRFLRGTFDGDLGTSDTRGRRYRLHFKLERRGNELFGSLTAGSRPGEPVLTLSHFMRVTRQ